MYHYIVQLEQGVWLASGEGDPARTLIKGNARVYGSGPAAKGALTRARKYRDFKNAKIERIPIR